MHKVKNIGKSSIYPVAGEGKPGDSCEVTPTDYTLLKSNGRIADYVEPPKAPTPPPKKSAPKKPAADAGFL